MDWQFEKTVYNNYNKYRLAIFNGRGSFNYTNLSLYGWHDKYKNKHKSTSIVHWFSEEYEEARKKILSLNILININCDCR